MVAIGLNGQMGLDGGLPWEGDPRAIFKDDVARFFELTEGHVLLAGPITIAAVPEVEAKKRTLVVLRSSMDPDQVLAAHAGRRIFIGGGPPVWDVYAKYIGVWDIARLPYDGPADRWFNPAWLMQAQATA